VIELDGVTRDDALPVRFVRCLGCGEPLHSDESRQWGAGAACRERLGDLELARRRSTALAGERAHFWLGLAERT
jgi:hypothetical protein